MSTVVAPTLPWDWDALRSPAWHEARSRKRAMRAEFKERRDFGLERRHATKLARIHAECEVDEDGTVRCVVDPGWPQQCPSRFRSIDPVDSPFVPEARGSVRTVRGEVLSREEALASLPAEAKEALAWLATQDWDAPTSADEPRDRADHARRASVGHRDHSAEESAERSGGQGGEEGDGQAGDESAEEGDGAGDQGFDSDDESGGPDREGSPDAPMDCGGPADVPDHHDEAADALDHRDGHADPLDRGPELAGPPGHAARPRTEVTPGSAARPRTEVSPGGVPRPRTSLSGGCRRRPRGP